MTSKRSSTPAAVEDLGGVLAGRDDGHATPRRGESVDEAEGPWKGGHAASRHPLEEERVLAQAQPDDRVPIGRVGAIALRQADAPRGEEVADSGFTGLAVHEASVVVLVERAAPSGSPPTLGRAVEQERVEELLPGGAVDGGGVGDDAVHVEDHGSQPVEGEVAPHAGGARFAGLGCLVDGLHGRPSIGLGRRVVNPSAACERAGAMRTTCGHAVGCCTEP